MKIFKKLFINPSGLPVLVVSFLLVCCMSLFYFSDLCSMQRLKRCCCCCCTRKDKNEVKLKKIKNFIVKLLGVEDTPEEIEKFWAGFSDREMQEINEELKKCCQEVNLQGIKNH